MLTRNQDVVRIFRSSEVTPEHDLPLAPRVRDDRLAGAVGLAAGATLAPGGRATLRRIRRRSPPRATRSSSRPTRPTPSSEITTYNNFYEFGIEKSDPAQHAGTLKVKPWTVKVDGLVDKPGNYGVEDLVNFKALEERVYRLPLRRSAGRW